METTKIRGEKRNEYGTRHARRLRAAGRLPAIIYGHGQPPESISVDRHEVDVALHHGARILEVELGGVAQPYLIKDVQYDHLGDTPVHLDLARVDLAERVRVRVGITLKGTPKGAGHGGILDQLMADVEVECRVLEIPDTLHPSVADLDIGESLCVRDLHLPPGVVVVDPPDARIAVVRALHEEAPVTAPAEGEEQAEPEVIARGKKEEEEAAAEEA